MIGGLLESFGKSLVPSLGSRLGVHWAPTNDTALPLHPKRSLGYPQRITTPLVSQGAAEHHTWTRAPGLGRTLRNSLGLVLGAALGDQLGWALEREIGEALGPSARTTLVVQRWE